MDQTSSCGKLCGNHRFTPRYQTSYTTPCNGVTSHGAPIGSIWIFAYYTRGKKERKKKCLHTHLTNQGHFDHRRNLNTPAGAPCREANGANSQISGLNLLWQPIFSYLFKSKFYKVLDILIYIDQVCQILNIRVQPNCPKNGRLGCSFFPNMTDGVAIFAT